MKPCGALSESAAPITTPGSEPTRMLAASPKSTLPPTQWATAGRREQDRGVDDVGAHHPLGREPVDGDQEDRDHGARAGRGDADHETGGGADHDGGDLVAALDLEAVALLDQVAEDQGPRQGDDPDHQQSAAEHRVDERVEAFFADLALEHGDQGDAGDRGRDAAEARAT